MFFGLVSRRVPGASIVAATQIVSNAKHTRPREEGRDSRRYTVTVWGTEIDYASSNPTLAFLPEALAVQLVVAMKKNLVLLPSLNQLSLKFLVLLVKFLVLYREFGDGGMRVERAGIRAVRGWAAHGRTVNRRWAVHRGRAQIAIKQSSECWQRPGSSMSTWSCSLYS